MRRAQPVRFRFVINNEDPKAKPADIRRRLNQAVKEAVTTAKKNNVLVKAKTETEGGVFGLGETAVILAIAHAAKAGGAAFALGAAGAAGKSFFENFLAPQLRKLNLLPTKLEEIPAKTKPGPAKKKAKKKSSGR